MRGRRGGRDRLIGRAEKNSSSKPTTGTRQVNSAYYSQVAVPAELGCSTSSQLDSTSSAVLVPLGSTEQHGPHLPLDTDTRIATAVARATATRLCDGQARGRQGRQWLVAPAIAYGASAEHQGFAGTISLGTEALTTLLVEYVRSATCWSPRLAFINGHGGNLTALNHAMSLLRSEGRDIGWCSCSAVGADPHAGHTETSLVLYLSPADVLTDRRCAGNGAPLPELLPSMRRGGLAAVTRTGVLGDPTTATAAEGKRLFAEMVDGCVERVARWAPRDDGMLT